MNNKIITLLTACLIMVTLKAHAQWVTFPVVFHVLYGNAQQNIPDSCLQHQLDVLNEDFNATNPDIVNVPAAWQPLIGSMNISFIFASIDPQGNSTNGIERRACPVNGPSNAHAFAQGGLDPWPDTSYLNIWVYNLPTGLLAYATFRGAPGVSGMDMDYIIVGRGTYASYPYNRGRIATHELGHYFGLYHIWGDDAGSCSGSDSIADTPNQADETYGYNPPGTIITDQCTPTAPGIMWMNYMDFSNDSAMCFFTLDQCARMTNTILAFRFGFLTPDGFDGIGEQEKHSQYSIFPSPSATGILQVNREDANANAIVEVYDLQGRLIEQPIQFSPGSTTLQIDLSSFANGTYTVIIRNENAVETKRIVISR